jgi:hypothetical protein
VVGHVFLVMWSQGPIDEGPAAFPERVMVLLKDRPPHHASTGKLQVTHR